ncbi:hypothetical protein Dimus_004771 [Dionaea muscipula]
MHLLPPTAFCAGQVMNLQDPPFLVQEIVKDSGDIWEKRINGAGQIKSLLLPGGQLTLTSASSSRILKRVLFDKFIVSCGSLELCRRVVVRMEELLPNCR